MKYRKTALVEAEQFLPSIGQIPSGVISDGNGDPRRNPERYSWIVASLEGNHHAKDGDYICTGIKGEKWVVDKEIFEATYELVNAAAPPIPADKVMVPKPDTISEFDGGSLRGFCIGIYYHEREKFELAYRAMIEAAKEG